MCLVAGGIPPVEGLEVDKDVGEVPSPEREGPTVNQRVALVKYHVPRFHGDVDREAVPAVDLEGPGLVDVLGDVDDPAADQGDPIDVGAEDGTGGVLPDPVQRHRPELGEAARPLGNGVDGGVPDLLLEGLPAALVLGVSDVEDVRGGLPVVLVCEGRVVRFDKDRTECGFGE